MVAFSIFWVSVYWYWIFYAVTFLFAYYFLLFMSKQDFFKSCCPSVASILSNHLDTLFLYAVFGVLIGWRLGHIFIYDFQYYLHKPLEMFMVWKWWMSFIGWIIGVVSALFLFLRKYKISLYELFVVGDLFFVPTSFGIMLGRVWNFLNQELYGIPVNTSFLQQYPVFSYIATKIHIFYVYSHIDTLLRINTNMLSSFFEWAMLFVGLLSVLWYFKKKRVWHVWLSVGIFFVWYSLIRFLFEYIRADSQLEFIGWFTKSQWFFVLFFLMWIAFLAVRKYIFPAKQ